jgi:hypothetical protein
MIRPAIEPPCKSMRKYVLGKLCHKKCILQWLYLGLQIE